MNDAVSALGEFVRTLPAWVRWGPVVFYPMLVVGVLVPTTWLLESWSLRPLSRLPRDAHWSERARLGFPARVRLVAWSLAATSLVATSWVLWLGQLTPTSVAIAPSLAVLVVTGLAAARARRLAAPERPPGTLRGWLVMLALGRARFGVAVVALGWVGERLDSRAFVVVSVTALVLWALEAGLGVRLAAMLGLVAPASERLSRAFEHASATSEAGAPTVLEADLPTANAFGLLLRRIVVISRALERSLDDDALRALAICETRALDVPASVRVARLVGLVPLALLPLLRPVHASLGAGAVGVLLACLVGLAGAARLVRIRAERGGVEAAQPLSDAAYARVVETMHRLDGIPVSVSGLWSRRAVEPRARADDAERDVRPRPSTPGLLAPLVACFTLALTTLVGARMVLVWAELFHGEQLGVMHIVLATTGGDAHAFAELGRARYLAGDVSGAALAYAAVAELRPEDAEPRALAARLRILEGDCRGALDAAWDASVVAERSGSPRERQLARSVRLELERCTAR